MSDSIETENLPVAAPTTANFLAVISKAASDPNTDVSKMHGLLDVQERMIMKLKPCYELGKDIKK